LLPHIADVRNITTKSFEVDTGAKLFQWTIPEPDSLKSQKK
jgi:hypothetical protein